MKVEEKKDKEGNVVEDADGYPVTSAKRVGVVHPYVYCSNLVDHATVTSTWWTIIGIPMLAAGTGVTVAGGGLTIDAAADDDDKSTGEYRKDVLANGAILSAGALAVGLGVYALVRSSSAADAAAEANMGIRMKDPNDAMLKCIDAKSTWVGSRRAANEQAQAAASESVQKKEEKTDEQKQAEEEAAKKKAEEAAAAAAKKKAGPLGADAPPAE